MRVQAERPTDTLFLDGIRILLALWVFSGHFYAAIGGPGAFHLPLEAVLLAPGAAVDGFMLISGFLMTFNFCQREEREDPRRLKTALAFYVRRLCRLYPVYLVAVVISLLTADFRSQQDAALVQHFAISGLHALGRPIVLPETFSQAVDALDVIAHLLLLNGLVPAYTETIVGVAWSLSLEMQFYLVFPALYVFVLIGKRPWAPVALFAAALVAARAAPVAFGLYLNAGLFAHFPQPGPLPYKLHVFLLGMLAAQTLVGRLRARMLVAAVALTALVERAYLSGMVIIFLGLLFSSVWSPYAGPLGRGVVGAVRAALSSRPARVGANLSYSLYLVHVVIFPSVALVVARALSEVGLDRGLTAVAALVASLLVTMAVSGLLSDGGSARHTAREATRGESVRWPRVDQASVALRNRLTATANYIRSSLSIDSTALNSSGGVTPESPRGPGRGSHGA